MYADDALAGMLHMRMQRAAVIEALQRLGVDRIEVTRRNVTDGAAFDLVMEPSEGGFVVSIKKIESRRRKSPEPAAAAASAQASAVPR